MIAKRYDALIIGAGPAGATAALLLAKAGWSVGIVEQGMFPRRKVCGEFVSATSFPLLYELGVGDTFASLAGPEVRRLALFADREAPVAPIPKASSAVGSWGRALGREHLDLLLLETARRAGAKVWQRYKAIALTTSGEGWHCTLSGKEGFREVSSRIVIAAHGSWSHGQLVSPTRRKPHPTDLFGFKAHFQNSDLAPDLMPLLIFPGGYGGMVTSDQGRVSLSCCIRRDMLTSSRRRAPSLGAGEAVFQHILESCEAVRTTMRRVSVSGPWLSAGPIRPGIRTSFENGIFRIGNLAGEAHPIIAEGISMAMQSAEMLCRELIATQDAVADKKDLALIGRQQTARWRARFSLRVRVANALAQTALRPSTAQILVQPAAAFPALLTWGAALSGKATMPTVARASPKFR